MLRMRIQTRMLVAIFVVMTFVSTPLSALGQKASPVAPTKAQIEAVVREAYEKFRSDTSGKNADYIPFLAQVDSKMFGVAVVSTDNQVFSMGEINYAFSIQSISKVYTLALAMEELGAERVFERIGSEPTGRAFNSVNAVVEMPTHTANPLVNAGAIATTSLISGKDANDKWNKILSMLLAKYERIYADPFESVDIYTKQCSVGVNVIQLARMGATLANNGKNPVTGEQIIKPDNVPYILSAMTMAGLYDGSGGWAWKVGLPAKSGVGGGIVAIVPGKGAIAVFSPRLDEAGNSVKAQRVIEYVTNKLDFNVFSPRSVGLKGE